MSLLLLHLMAYTAHIDIQGMQSYSLCAPDTIEISCGADGGCQLYLILPVRSDYSNINPGEGPTGLGVDTLAYRVFSQGVSADLVPGADHVPPMGTFYVSSAGFPGDTIYLVEPPHLQMDSTVQISIRPDDTYFGYMMELINTPFIMAPRRTPNGSHQSDCRLGTDCAGLAVYGRRRSGFNVQYLGPSGITEYLEETGNGRYFPRDGVFTNEAGETAASPSPGDILHFGSQVSIFLEDRGVPGILDKDDLVLQSWFDGPHFCTMEENGFYGHPVMLYRWVEQ